MTVRDELDELVRRAPRDLLSQRRRANTPLVEPCAVLDVLPLGSNFEVVLMADDNVDVFVAPMTADPMPRRAIAGDGVSSALLARFAEGSLALGDFEFERFFALAVTGERPILVDQTNESVIVGDQAVVKWFTRATERHPAADRIRRLQAAGFHDMPAPWGFVWWRGSGRQLLIASVSSLLVDATDGWEWCVELVEECARGHTDLATALAPVHRVAEMAVAMNVALASGTSAVVDGFIVAAWWAAADAMLDDVLATVDASEGARLRRSEPAMREAFNSLGRIENARVVPTHGDLHVGQFLRHHVEGGWAYAVTDFDGNPVLEADVRGEWQPLARDVASLVQSLDHVGRVVIKRSDAVDVDIDVDVVRQWIRRAQEVVVQAYLSHPVTRELLDQRLLFAFRVEQECREFRYALTHLPHWRYVPDAALADLLEG